MITRITKANADKYRVLFNEAVQDLLTHDINGNPNDSENYDGNPVIKIEFSYEEVQITEKEFEPGFHYIYTNEEWQPTSIDAIYDENARYAIRVESGESITTLQEYFFHIADLQKINEKYTVLPLDEDMFYINANTRTIEVPKPFKDNGVAVVGDEVAEILYFKVDRFFDMDDLAAKDVFIQWRIPAVKEGKPVEGLSMPWIFSADIEPDYVIFGWPLSSEITSQAGKIEFSVRFYAYDAEEKKILYSLSTLPATVTVKDGLNYNLEEMLLDGSNIIDASDLIVNRLINSEPVNGNIPTPTTPIIFEHIFEDCVAEKRVDEEGKEYYDIYLTDVKTGNETNGRFAVQAKVEDTGILSYTWIKKDLDGDLATDSLTSGYLFVENNDSVRDLNKIYYYKNGEGVYTEYKFINDETTFDPEVTLYERLSCATINYNSIDEGDEKVLGTYQVRATNRLGRKTSSAYGPIARVLGPAEPKITKDLSKESDIRFDENLQAELRVTATVDSHAYNTYLFQKQDEKGEFVNIATQTEPTYTVIGGEYGSEDDGDGYYRVVVESKLNSTMAFEEGEAIRITHEASPVKIMSFTLPNLGSDGYATNKDIVITVEPNEYEKRTEEDVITYQWYKYKGSDENLQQDISDAIEGKYQVTGEDEKLEGKTSNVLNITNTPGGESGRYFCEITNKYNGSTAVICSKFFRIEDNN